MKDSTGRKLKEGDVLLCVANYNYGEIGIVIDDSIRVLSNVSIKKTSGYTYLLENPTLEECNHAAKIVNSYNNYLAEKEIKKKQKKEYGKLIGGVYSTVLGDQYVYLGKFSVTDYDGDEQIFQKEGNVYICIPYMERIVSGGKISALDADDLLGTFRNNLSIIKGYKTVDGFLGLHPDLKHEDFRNVLGKHKVFLGTRF